MTDENQSPPMTNPTQPASGPSEEIQLPPWFFVIDVESVGLHGEPFAVGWSVHSRMGGHYEEGYFACPMGQARGSDEDRAWCEKNIPAIRANRDTPLGVRDAFWSVWELWKKEGAVLVADCGWPVEARFLALCIADNPSRKWEGPYPMHDVASVRLALGFDPLATLPRNIEELPKHHPMKDARQSGRLLSEALKSFTNLRARAAMAEELAEQLKRANNMLRAVVGDVEDGYSFSGLREKYATALLNCSDDCHSVLTKFTATKGTT